METAKYQLSIIMFNDNNRECNNSLQQLLEQSLLKKNPLQIILVNCVQDESDELAELCEKNKDIIKVISQVESGADILGKAMELAEGKFIHFTKAGVRYPEDSLEKIADQMEQNDVRVGIVRIRCKGKQNELREQNGYLSENTEIARENLQDYFRIIHNNYFSYFFRKDILAPVETEGNYWFLSVMRIVFCTVVTEKELFKIMDCHLRILKANLALDDWRMMLKDQKHLDFIEDFLKPVYQYVKDNEKVLKNNVEYNFLYYMKQMQTNLLRLSDEKLEELQNFVDTLMTYVKNKEVIILNQYYDRIYKSYLLKKYQWAAVKNDREDWVAKEKDIHDERFAVNTFLFIKVKNDVLTLEGRTLLYNEHPFDVYIEWSGVKYKASVVPKESYMSWFGKKISHTQYYSCDIPLAKGKSGEILVKCVQNGREIEKMRHSYGTYAPVANKVFTYVCRENWVFYKEMENGSIWIEEKSDELLKKLKRIRRKDFLTQNRVSRKAFGARLLYNVLSKFKKKQIWLISDRTTRGDDNGECFFKYLHDHPQKDVTPYFVIDKSCPDYSRMKQYGKVVSVFSWKHKILHLLSDYLISSQANKPVINPFGRIGNDYYQDIIADKRLIFLQHGVTKDDISDWLNRYNRNLYGFVTTTRAEYQSIFDYNYFYTEKEVWLTGFPRHDYLEKDEQKCVVIMPTWRKTLSDGTNDKGEWILGKNFINSEFFQFYNSLLNHERLISKAKKYGYKICFFPHPNIRSALGMFDKHEEVIFWEASKTYREVYAQSDLILTDYSSAVFDFAYLRKPVLYSQFDREEFFSGGHSYVEGYYDYFRDGFGEVEVTLEGTVDRLIEYMENGCQLKEEYKRRIENTFMFNDRNCCERVLKKIRENDI